MSDLSLALNPRNSHAWARAWNLTDRHWLIGSGFPASPPDAYLRWLNGGSFLPPHRLLVELEPALPSLYRDGDPRLALAKAFVTVWNRVNPFAPFGLVHVHAREDWTDILLEASFPSEPGAPDLASLLPVFLRAFPRAFGLPPYEEVLAVGTHPAAAMSKARKSASPFSGGPPSADAASRQARLYRVGFSSSRSTEWNALSRILRDLAAREGSAEAPSVGRPIGGSVQLDIPSRPPGKRPCVHRFVYHRSDDSLSCDGRHLARQVPARILRRLLRDYVSLGQREFEFRALKRDPEIVTNRKRPNFEVRLRRVEEVVKRMPCGMVLHHPRPGLVELEAVGFLEYAEEQ